MQAQETPTPTPTVPYVPEEHRRARHTPSGLFFVLGGFVLAAAGAVMIVAPKITPEVAYYAKVIPERTGTTPGQLCLAGLIVLGIGMIAHYIRLHIKTLLTPGLAENALIDVMADVAEVQNALRILINDQLDTRHEIAYVKQEVTDHRDETRANNPKDALFGLAASLDKLGVRIDKRIGEAASLLQDNSYEVSSLVETSRNEVLTALDEAAERSNEMSGALDTLRSMRVVESGEGEQFEESDELDEDYVSDDPDALDPNYERNSDLTGEDFLGEVEEEPREPQSLGLLDNLNDFDDESDEEYYDENEQPEATQDEHSEPEATQHPQPEPEAMQPEPEAMQPEQPEQPEQPQPEQPQPEAMQPEQPQPMAVQPEEPQPMAMQPEQPQPMAMQPEEPQPMAMQPEEPQPMAVQPEQPQPMGMQPQQPHPMAMQPEEPQPTATQHEEPRLSLALPGQPQPETPHHEQPQAGPLHAQEAQPPAGRAEPAQPWAEHVESLQRAAGSGEQSQPVVVNLNGPQPALPGLPPMPNPTPISLAGQASDFDGMLGPGDGLPPHSPSETDDRS